jgi:hypothetical protein
LADLAYSQLFNDIRVLGELPPRRVAAKLQQLGDPEGAEEFKLRSKEKDSDKFFDLFKPKAWEHTTHVFGYLPLRTEVSDAPQSIRYAGSIKADDSLRNSRINVHLDRLRVFDYPGGGEHMVMFTFMAQNQISQASEPVSFSQRYEVQENQLAGIAGWPIFVGLNVGSLGVALQGFTVNVKNKNDEAMLNYLNSSPFQSGLNLLKTAQPAIKPFVEMTLGVAQSVMTRNRNVPVQKFYLGLDFTTAALGFPLAQGNFIAVQVPSENSITWDEWVYMPNSGAVVAKSGSNSTIPFNYVIFRISRYED